MVRPPVLCEGGERVHGVIRGAGETKLLVGAQLMSPVTVRGLSETTAQGPSSGFFRLSELS